MADTLLAEPATTSPARRGRLGPSPWHALAYVAPALVVYATFVLYPLGRAVHLFNYSNTYLALLFAAVAADPLVRTIR